MKLALTTAEIDCTVALKAYKLYKEANYREALPILLDILDVEPSNWQARLFLGVCYYKTGTPMAAERAIRAVYERCPDKQIKQIACFALHTVRAKTIDGATAPAHEFADYLRKHHLEAPPLETIIC